MSDTALLAGWKPKFDHWVEKAVPFLKAGDPKKAFATYPFVKTEGDPFTKPSKLVGHMFDERAMIADEHHDVCPTSSGIVERVHYATGVRQAECRRQRTQW